MILVELREKYIPEWTRRSNRDYNWDDFNSEKYLDHNYREIDRVDAEFLEDLVKFYKKEQPSGLFLEVGAGSNMYPILAALPYADTIDVLEYGAQNIAYLQKQREELDPDWQKWIEILRELDPDTYRAVDFQQQLQDKMIVNQGSIFDLPKEKYDNISMHSVAESLTKIPREFRKAVRCFIDSGKPGSTLAATFVEKSEGYDSAGLPLPALAIEAWDAVRIFGSSMRSLRFGSTKAEIRPGSPLITVMGRKK